MKHLNNAIKQWKKDIGSQFVDFTKSRKTGGITTTLYPRTHDHIKAIMKTSHHYRIPLYPISTGKNWGYGSLPENTEIVIVSLSKMNSILDYNDELGYITIEAGVTFEKAYKFLLKNQSTNMLSVTGASPETSIVAHVLERGISKGPLSDPSNNVCGISLVLPTGESVHTGYSRFSNAKAQHISRNSLGPQLDGLFIQSNFGIVTSLTIWLKRKPKEYQIVYFYLKNSKKLQSCLCALKKLKESTIVQGNFLLSNAYRMLAVGYQYPWDRMNGKTPLNDTVAREMRSDWEWIGDWYGEFALYGYEKNQLVFLRKAVETNLQSTVDGLLVIDKKMAEQSKIRYHLLKEADNNQGYPIHKVYEQNPYIGVPTRIPLRTMYWRKKKPIPKTLNPEKDSCGGFWINAELPYTDHDFKVVNQIAHTAMVQYGFEPNIGFNFVSERALIMTAVLLYDREKLEEDRQARLCRSYLIKELSKKGYYPYRLGLSLSSQLDEPIDCTNQFLYELKRTIDPHFVLAPGRYDHTKHNS